MAFETDPPHILTADEIWKAQDIEERTVDVPEWGGSVRIRSFTKKQTDRMLRSATTRDRFGKDTTDNQKLEALLFVEGVIEPKFDLDDYERVLDKSAVVIARIIKSISEASGLSDLAVAEADKRVRAQPGQTIRVLPGAGAQDDTGGTLATDVGA
jgi:hypothetical protein